MMHAKSDMQKSAVAMLSVVSNILLVLLKLVIGIFIHSVSVISESIHSGVDLIAAIIALRRSGFPDNPPIESILSVTANSRTFRR